MKNISEKEFQGLKKTHHFYKLEMEFNVPLKEELQFFGTEIGNDVLVITVFNADICTSIHKVENAEIGHCNGKFIVIEKDASQVSASPSEVEVIENASIKKDNLDDLIDEAIGGAVADTTIKVSVVPPTTPSDAKEEAKQPVEKQVVEKAEAVTEEKKQQKAQEVQVTGSPVITKGKQTEVKPVDKKQSVINFKLAEPAPKKPAEKQPEKKQQPQQQSANNVNLAETIKKAKKEKYDPWSGSGW